jgi:FkbM family methyltransferase
MSIRKKAARLGKNPRAFIRDARYPLLGPVLKPGTKERARLESLLEVLGADADAWLPSADVRAKPHVARRQEGADANAQSLDQRIEALFDDFNELRGERFVELCRAFDRHRVVVFRDKFSRFFLHSLGLEPRTVVDVGVNYGTPDLYASFPKAKFLLLDPHPVNFQACMRLFPNLSYDFMQCAAGSAPGKTSFSVAPVSGHSSMMSRSDYSSATAVGEKQVEVVRLDHVLVERGYPAPYGIKVDTEGFELEVLKGAEGVLPNVEFIIAELSIKRIFKDGYRFSEVIEYLGAQGFELFDVLNARGWAPNYLDCLFLPYGHKNLEFASG